MSRIERSRAGAGGAFFVAGGLSVFFAVAAALYFERRPLPLRAELALYCCLILLLIYCVLPGAPVVRMTAQVFRRPWTALAILGAWLLPYAVYAAGTGDFRWMGVARLVLVCGAPLVVYNAAPVRTTGALCWQDGFAWGWLTLAVVLRQLNGIWNVPASLDFMTRLLVIAVASWCWSFVRPAPGLGYSFRISGRVLHAAAVNFGLFAIIAIPVGFAMRFAAWNPRWRGMGNFFLTYVEILVFIAWLEELLFRGFLQSLLARSFRSEVGGQAAASLAFGLSHVLLGAAPNWRYVALASIAGWFYGWAFRQGGNLVAPALTHALVDTVWRTWLTAG